MLRRSLGSCISAKRSRAFTAVGISTLTIAACVDQTPTAPATRPARSVSRQFPDTLRGRGEARRRHQDQYAQFERDIPGYGGHAFDRDGNLHVFLLDTTANAGRARAALAPLLTARVRSAHASVGGTSRVVVHRGRATIGALETWYEQLGAVVLQPGVTFVDLDEMNNQITVGLERDRAAEGRAAVERRAGQLGVPAGTITYETNVSLAMIPACSDPTAVDCTAPEPPPPDTTSASSFGPSQEPDFYTGYDPYTGLADKTLASRFRGIEGGVAIEFYRPAAASQPGRYGCTLGFNAYLDDGRRAFVTASHCSAQMGVVDQTGFYQPTINISFLFNNYVGAEARDAAFRPADYYACDVDCKFSDAGAVVLNPFVSWNFGYIARPTGYGTFSATASGSTVINASNPRFQITGKKPYPLLNDVYDKIGQVTGWTYGYVDRTCVTIRTNEPYTGREVQLVCQDFLETTVHEGDSGGPVFVYQGNTVLLGGTVTSTRSDGKPGLALNAISNAESDLGSLRVY